MRLQGAASWHVWEVAAGGPLAASGGAREGEYKRNEEEALSSRGLYFREVQRRMTIMPRGYWPWTS